MKRFLLAATMYAMVANAASAAPPPGLEEYRRAQGAFDALVKSSGAKGGMPRLSDPAAAPLLRVLSDVDGVLGDTPYGKDDLTDLMDVCGNNTPMTAYMMFGVNRKVTPNTTADDVTRVVTEATEKNMHRYQDELFPLMAFNIHCVARSIPALTDFVASLPESQMTQSRQHSLARSRLNAISVYMGAMLIFRDQNIASRNRTIILDALADTADVYAGMLQQNQRQSIASLAEGLRSKVDASLYAWLDRISSAMKRSDCEGLCRF